MQMYFFVLLIQNIIFYVSHIEQRMMIFLHEIEFLFRYQCHDYTATDLIVEQNSITLLISKFEVCAIPKVSDI